MDIEHHQSPKAGFALITVIIDMDGIDWVIVFLWIQEVGAV